MSDDLICNGFHPDDYNFYAGGNQFNLSASYNAKGQPPLRGYADVTQLKGYAEIPEMTEDHNFEEDIAQSRFYTISISEIKDKYGKPIVFSTGEGTWMSFLPVKNISFSFTNYDNLSVPFAVLGDIPVLQRKKVSTISIACYDTDDDIIEQALVAWEKRCFPKGKYVAYLSNIKADFIYKSYDVKGRLNYTRRLHVIPASGVSVNRGYDENSEKLLSFSVASIGELNEPVSSVGYSLSTTAQLATKTTTATLVAQDATAQLKAKNY